MKFETISASKFREAIASVQRSGPRSVEVRTEGDETWVSIDGGPERLVTADSPNPEQTLRREGWRPRLANVERLLAEYVAKGDDSVNRRYLVEPALREVRELLDGETTTEGLVRLDAADVALISSWVDEPLGRCEGGDGMRALLERLRREVGV